MPAQKKTPSCLITVGAGRDWQRESPKKKKDRRNRKLSPANVCEETNAGDTRCL